MYALDFYQSAHHKRSVYSHQFDESLNIEFFWLFSLDLERDMYKKCWSTLLFKKSFNVSSKDEKKILTQETAIHKIKQKKNSQTKRNKVWSIKKSVGETFHT